MFQKNKILISSTIAIILIALLFWFTFYFRQNQTQDNLSQIENWSLYQEITNSNEKFVGAGDCSQAKNFNQEFADFKKQASLGSIKQFLYNGVLVLVITPNYDNWTNEKFLAFNSDGGAICSAGGRYPLKAYADKLLWITSCSTGVMLEEDSPAYTDFIKCTEAKQVIEAYFAKN